MTRYSTVQMPSLPDRASVPEMSVFSMWPGQKRANGCTAAKYSMYEPAEWRKICCEKQPEYERGTIVSAMLGRRSSFLSVFCSKRV